MSTDGATLIERIKARRTYADRPVTDSDNSERSPADTTAETLEESQQDAPPRENHADTDNAIAQNTTETDNGHEKMSRAESSGYDTVSEKKLNPNDFEKSTEIHFGKMNSDQDKECFQTMMAEALSDSEEENDKIHTCIDFADIKFKGTLFLKINCKKTAVCQSKARP